MKYEFKFVGGSDLNGLERQLNDLGRDGWRVASMAVTGQIVRVVMERPLEARDQ